MTTLSPSDLAAIEDRAAKATPGPWHPRDDDSNGREKPLIWYEGGGIVYGHVVWSNSDTEFIAASRSDVPRLCDTIRQQWARIAELEAENARMKALLTE